MYISEPQLGQRRYLYNFDQCLVQDLLDDGKPALQPWRWDFISGKLDEPLEVIGLKTKLGTAEKSEMGKDQQDSGDNIYIYTRQTRA